MVSVTLNNVLTKGLSCVPGQEVVAAWGNRTIGVVGSVLDTAVQGFFGAMEQKEAALGCNMLAGLVAVVAGGEIFVGSFFPEKKPAYKPSFTGTAEDGLINGPAREKALSADSASSEAQNPEDDVQIVPDPQVRAFESSDSRFVRGLQGFVCLVAGVEVLLDTYRRATQSNHF